MIAVVAAFVDQPPDNEPDGLRADAATLVGGRHEQVDAGMPIARLELLGRLDEPDHLVARRGEDGERRLVGVGLEQTRPEPGLGVSVHHARDGWLAR